MRTSRDFFQRCQIGALFLLVPVLGVTSSPTWNLAKGTARFATLSLISNINKCIIMKMSYHIRCKNRQLKSGLWAAIKYTEATVGWRGWTVFSCPCKQWKLWKWKPTCIQCAKWSFSGKTCGYRAATRNKYTLIFICWETYKKSDHSNNRTKWIRCFFNGTLKASN